MLPVPPLDGGNVLGALLPSHIAAIRPDAAVRVLIIIGLIAAGMPSCSSRSIRTPSSRCSSDGKGARRFGNAAHRPSPIGHLVGALRNWAALQDQCDCLYFVADWHALTSEYANTLALVGNALDNVADWIAGRRSRAEHDLCSVARARACGAVAAAVDGRAMPWLERVPTYKEQREQITDKDLSNVGFLNYPLLQTADIAIADGRFVPVGDDQVAHLELSREAVRRFNQFYGEVLVEPQPLLTSVPRLVGLDTRR